LPPSCLLGLPLAGLGAVALAGLGAVALAGLGAVALAGLGAVALTGLGAVALAGSFTLALSFSGCFTLISITTSLLFLPFFLFAFAFAEDTPGSKLGLHGVVPFSLTPPNVQPLAFGLAVLALLLGILLMSAKIRRV
jgi:hypothetical protein